GGAQGAGGLPGVAPGGGAETLGVVDLIAVAGADVVEDASHGALVLRGVLVGAKRREQPKRRGGFRCRRRAEQLDQALAFRGLERGVKDRKSTRLNSSH